MVAYRALYGDNKLWCRPYEMFLDEVNKNMVIYPNNHFAVLIDERYFAEFEEIVNQYPEIDTLYFVTDSDAGYREMISGYQHLTTVQLYKDYLDNFRINTGR